MAKELPGIKVLKIGRPLECRIIERLNRFVVLIEIAETEYRAHITNTGRLSELIVRGQKAYCFRTHHRGRTDFRLFAIDEQGLGALIDTWLQMKAFEKSLERNIIPWLAGCSMLKRNAPLGVARIDYLLKCAGKDEIYLELKSAVLRDGVCAMYPDCPSDRGRKHIHELSDYVHAGGKGILLFMAALPYVTEFKPNKAADAKIYEALTKAHVAGVDVRAIGLYYNPTDSWVCLFNLDLETNIS